MVKKEKKNDDTFWKPFIIFGLLLILYQFLTFSESYLTLLFAYILGSLIGLSVALMIFSNKKAFITSIVLLSIAIIYSIVIFFSLSGFFLIMRIIFAQAILVLIIFFIIFWIYKKIRKK
jgi:hypothetical protein